MWVNGVINRTVAGCFGTNERAAVGSALTCQNSGKLVAKSLILTVKITDLSCANTDITGGNVGICADVLCKLSHKALAEAHNLSVRLALRVEVGATLSSSHRKTCKRVLEALLKAEELHNGEVYGRMETKTALVRTDSGIKLNAEAAVYLYFTVIVDPAYTEHNSALGLYHTVNDTCLNEIRALLYNGLNCLKNFLYCLKKLRLICVSACNSCINVCKILIFE